MHSKIEAGCIVWHDLLTNDIAGARHFYAELLGWEYQVEHASDCVWQAGEADYPLIIAHGEAHGGFVEAGQNVSPQWVAYAQVEDVNTIAAQAKALGATIARAPFDVPGVGRSAVLRDPQGATICPHAPTHGFPPPYGTFLWDELVTDDPEPARVFYSQLFGWKTADIKIPQMRNYTLFGGAGGTDLSGAVEQLSGSTVNRSTWVTYLATGDVDTAIAKARKLGASLCIVVDNRPHMGRCAVLKDPTSAIFGLLAPDESRKRS